MKELECSQDFPHYNPIEAIYRHKNQSFPDHSDATDEIWFISVSWSLRYSGLKVWTDVRTDARQLPSYKLPQNLWLQRAENVILCDI